MSNAFENSALKFSTVPENQNDLDVFIQMDTIEVLKQNKQLIEGVTFGVETGSNLKNDIYVSTCCALEHDGNHCLCCEILNQEALTNFPISIEIAQNIAYYVSGLLGGKRVFQG